MDLKLEPIRDSNCTLCPLGGMASSERDVCRVESQPTPYLIVVKTPPSEKMKKEILNYLSEVGFNPDDFSFTAAVKCRVWDANITKTMTKTCSSNYLSQELDRHQYKWILAFGNEALQATTGKAQVTKYRAQVHPSIHRAETKVFPTIAPGAVSRNPGQRASFIADLTYFRTLSEASGGTSKRLPDRVRMITSPTGLRTLRDDLLTCEGYAFDIETNGFNEYEAGSEVVSLALSTWDKGATEPQRCYAIPLSHPESQFAGNWRQVLAMLAKYVGVPQKRVAHNCFSADSTYISRTGVRALGNSVGPTEVWTKQGWQQGQVREYGRAEIWDLTLVPARYRSNISHTIHTTDNHRWPLVSGDLKTTDELVPGDRIVAERVNSEASHDSEAFIHGLIFADGSLTSKQPKDGFKYQVRLCGAKAKWLYLFEQFTYPPSSEGDPVVTGRLGFNPKELPVNPDTQYIADFIEGWQIMDGTDYGAGRDVRMKSKEHAQWLLTYAASGGWFATGFSIHDARGYKPGSLTHSVKLSKGGDSKPVEWRVKAVESTGRIEPVYCVEVPGVERFTLSGGIYTGNSKFDMRWLRQFGCYFDASFDTMLAAHLLDENRAKGLKPLARSLLNVPPWDMDVKNLQDEPIKKVLKYNALDTWYTAHLYFIFRDQLKERPRLANLFLRMSMPATNIFTEIERKGIWVDREILQTNAKISRDTLEGIDAELMTHVPPRDEWPANLKEVNFNASNFARWLLFEHLGLPVIARGKDKEDGSPGNPSMAEGVLQMLNKRHPHPVLTLLLSRVKWQKFSSSFFSSYLDQIDDKDRIHTTFKLTGTVTGRLSSGKGDADKVTGRVSNRGVNLQQVPRDKFVKGIFGGAPGSVFLECDYSQVELRVAAAIAREPTMISLYQNGEDIHMATAMKMTGKPKSQVTGDERKKAKPVNFGFLYGMSANTFVDTAWNNYGVEVTPHEAEVFRRAYFEQFPMLLEWHRKQRALAQKYGRVESPLGRVRHLPDVYSPDRKVAAEAGRQAINSPVQSFASDLAILALVNISRDFKRRGLKALSVGAVHDALNFEVPEDEVRIAAPLIKYHMENYPLAKNFGYHMPVQIIGDVAISRQWGDKIEVPEETVMSGGKFDKWLKKNLSI